MAEEADVYLFPPEPTPSNIRLRPAAAGEEPQALEWMYIRMRRASPVILMKR